VRSNLPRTATRARTVKPVRLGAAIALFAVTLAAVAAVAQGRVDSTRRAALVTCPKQEHVLLHALIVIHANLDVGVSLANYKKLIVQAQIAYDESSGARDSRECILAVERHSAKALTAYNKALSSWSQCAARASVSTCHRRGSVADKFQQRQWRIAEANIRAAADALA
jgi:hypothetical protein